MNFSIKSILLVLFTILLSEPFEGLTLITSINKNNAQSQANQDEFDYTHLIDNNQNIINSWAHNTSPASIAYLTNDSLLYVPLSNPVNLNRGPTGGKFQIIDWNGEIIWDYILPSDICIPHHDIAILPNGNILALCTEYKSQSEVLSVGKINTNSDFMGLDMIIEIEPLDNNNAQIVWQWHFWDHLVQNTNPNYPKYGSPEDFPELLDINCNSNGGSMYDWTHCNSISYNDELQQILLTSRHMNEIYIIDHSTTIEEAGSNAGGKYGKGGDFLYRWGNPSIYNRNNFSDFTLNAPHAANWINNNTILIFNNKHTTSTSSAIEINIPFDNNFIIPDSNYEGFGPSEFSWIYESNFFSLTQSGALRLPNGNTLITIHQADKIFEINLSGDIVWEYEGNLHSARAIKYPMDYLELSLVGDINNDHVINILDIIQLLQQIIELNYDSNNDLNSDGILNVLDLVTLVNLILN